MAVRWMKYIAVPALTVGAVFGVKAEQDFEFAKKLMDANNPSFPTDDLVEHLIGQLDQNPATKTESKLIKATYKRKTAGTSTVEKRRELLDEADALYKEVLADKNYKNRDIAEREALTINSARITTLVKQANELAKTNPAEAKKLRAEAAGQLDKIAATHKGDSDAKRGPFEEAYKKYETWNEKENPNFDKPIPPDILQPMAKSFDAWLIPHQKYVATRVEQLECYDETDPAKKKLGEELAKLCGETAEGKGVADFPVLVAWYNYMKGRSFSAIGDEKQSAEAWNDALGSGNPDEMAPPQKKAFLGIKKLILTDLVKMKMRGKKYGDVESIVVEARRDPGLRTLFDEDSGKGLILDYARALTLPEDATAAEYERAVKTLREYIVKEKAQTAWSNEFSRAIADILDERRRNKPNQRPKLSASEWYDAARGFFMLGQTEYKKFDEYDKDKNPKAKDQYEVAYKNYRSAVEYYRRAITEARKEKTQLVERLEIEPKSWFEMGLSYIKMKHYYEAVIANSAFRDAFLPEDRKRWMPDVTKPAYRTSVKQITELLAEIDKPKSGFLDKAGSNMLYAIDRNLALNKNPQDLWNRELKPRILSTELKDFDDGNVTDADYLTAKNDMDTASSLSKAAAHMKDAKVAEENYSQALDKYLSAADKFKKVKTTSPAYELALYQVGSAYTMGQAFWVTGKIPSRAAETKEKAKDMGEKALAAFNAYDEFLKKSTPKDDAEKERRTKLEGTILLARNSLHSGAGEWENVIKTSDAYIAWESKFPQPKSQQGVALMNKFRANLELGAGAQVPKGDAFLAEAEKTMRQWRKTATADNKVYKFMLTALSRRYNIAAAQVKFFVDQGKSEFNLDQMEPYELAVARLQKERVALLEGAEDEEPQLDDYSRLVYLFNKIGAYKEAIDAARKLLGKFDAENTNSRIPDEPKVWQDLLGRMQGVIAFDDLSKRDRARNDHKVLVDYMYDTAEGNNAASPETRPEFDKLKEDTERALKQLETIKKNYPNCQTMPDPKSGKPYSQFVPSLNEWVDANVGKSPKMKDLKDKAYLTVLEEEIDYRRKIVATREILSTLSLKMAQKLRQEGNDIGSNEYFEVANKQIEILSNLKGDTPALKNQRANIQIVLGKFDEALTLLNEVKVEAPDGSVPYFDASKRISEVYAQQKKWEQAAEYPLFMAVTIGFSAPIVKERWPDMKLFLKECFDNGVKCPPNLQKAMETVSKDPAAPAEEKKEEAPKTEEAKPDAPKADAPKTDAPKADAPAPAAGNNK